MIIKEKTEKFKGFVEIYNNTTKELMSINNIVCDGFYTLLADRMINDSVSAISYFAIGDSTTPVSTTDTAINNETFRKAVTNKSSPGSTITIATEIYGNEALGTWKEIGLLNASTSGTLTNHTNIDYTHTAGDILTITWNIEKA